MKLTRLVPTSLLLIGVASVRHYPGPWEPGPYNSSQALTAYTTNGPITGHLSANSSSVIEYLGIPYAKPPVGALRFTAPQPIGSNGAQIASAYGYSCPAPAYPTFKYPGLTPQAPRILTVFTGFAPGSVQDEDCLTLNIWQPRRSRGSYAREALPIIAYFYGGRFTTGASNTPFLDGTLWSARQDVIVVTINFRSNVFGYPGVPGQLANLGLRDQRLAVEWIAENAHAFGGDPDRIVIMGQSAGSVAVSYWAYAYVDDPIVSGLISHSGNVLSFPLNADGVVEDNWYNISAQLGCGNFGDTLSCMQTKSWESVLNASLKIPAAPSGNPLRSTPAFYPIVDNVTVFHDYEGLSHAGHFAKIPYFLGNTNAEYTLYAVLAYSRGVSTTDAQGTSFLLSSFTCPNFFVASSWQKYGVPVWLFRFFGDWDNLRLFPTSGAYHGSDVDIIYGNDAAVSLLPASAAEEQVTRNMQATWAAFARDPVNGLSRLGYPAFDAGSNSLIRFAYNDSPTASYVSPLVYAAACANVTLAGEQQ